MKKTVKRPKLISSRNKKKKWKILENSGTNGREKMFSLYCAGRVVVIWVLQGHFLAVVAHRRYLARMCIDSDETLGSYLSISGVYSNGMVSM